MAALKSNANSPASYHPSKHWKLPAFSLLNNFKTKKVTFTFLEAQWLRSWCGVYCLITIIESNSWEAVFRTSLAHVYMCVCVLVCVCKGRTMGLIEIHWTTVLFLEGKVLLQTISLLGVGEERIGIPGYMKWFLVLVWKLTFKGRSYMCATWLGKMDRVWLGCISDLSLFKRSKWGRWIQCEGSILHSWRCPGLFLQSI